MGRRAGGGGGGRGGGGGDFLGRKKKKKKRKKKKKKRKKKKEGRLGCIQHLRRREELHEGLSRYIFAEGTIESLGVFLETAGPPGGETDDAFDFLFKIILIGDSNVGKTCVVQSFNWGTRKHTPDCLSPHSCAGGGETDDAFDFLFKIILIGDSNVGKTCVVQSFKQDTFSSVSHWVREVELYGAANIVL
ncbi:hypothetical protein CRUP_012379, partial [Coryphaenoides rupestris]